MKLMNAPSQLRLLWTKTFAIASLSLVSWLSSCAVAEKVEKVEKPEYVSEAPLPEGWPKPGPYNEVTEKNYPAYRAAFTKGGFQNMAFFTLFSHIKRNNIPMTSPVEMTMKGENAADMTSMGFLYQNGKVGKLGLDGKSVEVKDVPATKVLSYTWMGDDTDTNIATAKKALDAALTESKREALHFRILGYNGPQTPQARKTWELQAVLK